MSRWGVSAGRKREAVLPCFWIHTHTNQEQKKISSKIPGFFLKLGNWETGIQGKLLALGLAIS